MDKKKKYNDYDLLNYGAFVLVNLDKKHQFANDNEFLNEVRRIYNKFKKDHLQ